jgi:hypothetical protein
MKKWMVFFVLFPSQFLAAQKVLYSPLFDGNGAVRHYQMAGKVASTYWVIREGKIPYGSRPSERNPGRDFEGYEIYNDRLENINSIDRAYPSVDVVKTYFVPGDKYFDEMMIADKQNHTVLRVNRYAPAGNLIWQERSIDSLPFHERANNFLLLRSEDQSRILLLAFENLFFSNPRVHAMLFNEEWNLLSYKTYTHEWLTQPMIQYDEFNFPVEPFSNSPVKLTNDGSWMMISPSRMNQNYLLFHFAPGDSGFTWKELKVPPAANIEDIGLSVDNENRQAFTGILCRLRYPTLKMVSLARYLLDEKKLVYDSSFKFNTLSGGKTKNENLVEENFISLPHGGFVLLKEYGRLYSSALNDESDFDSRPEAGRLLDDIVATPDAPAPVNRDGYTRYGNLTGPSSKYNRGDLSLFYFPSVSADSIWSGIINKEQVTELNSAYLSYLAIPYEDRLFLLYNSYFRNEEQYGSTTILDKKGNPLDEGGIVFWKLRNTLLFQRARQISANEVMIPYTRNRSEGFALIRF